MHYPVKYDTRAVQAAIDCIYSQLPAVTDKTIFLVLMNGGVWFSHELFRRYGCTPLTIYYAKVSSYDGKERKGLNVTYLPNVDFVGADVVVLDDICDSGATINSIHQYIAEQNPNSILFATLLKRAESDLSPEVNLISGIYDDSKDFFVGCGLDDDDAARNIPYIGIC